MVKQRVRIGTMKQKLPCLTFTPDQLMLLQKAVTLTEQMIRVNKEPLPNVNFALATVTQVQAKINRMIQPGIWSEAVELDCNEVLILQTAVWIFAAGLDFAEPSPENETLKEQCRTLNLLLAPLTKQARIKNRNARC